MQLYCVFNIINFIKYFSQSFLAEFIAKFKRLYRLSAIFLFFSTLIIAFLCFVNSQLIKSFAYFHLIGPSCHWSLHSSSKLKNCIDCWAISLVRDSRYLTVNIIRCSMSVRRYSLNFAPRPAPRGRDGKELIQCPTSSCDGMGHVSGNYATHRRQGTSTFTPSLWRDARLCIYRYGDAARTHARIHIYKYVNLCWPSLFLFLSLSLFLFNFLRKSQYWFSSKNVKWQILKHTCKTMNIMTHARTRNRSHTSHATSLSKFANYIYMNGSCITMHIGGPWRSCFLSVLRYKTYV